MLEIALIIALGLMFYYLSDNLKDKKVLFLGPSMSGKTTLMGMLMKEDFNPDFNPEIKLLDENREYTATAQEDTITYTNKKYNYQLTDMGGSPSRLVNGKFESLLKTNDVIVFLFDCAAYLDDLKYERDVNARLDFIWSMNDILKGKTLLFVGSHSDKLTIKKEEAVNHIRNRVNGKEYGNLLNKHLFVLGNLTDIRDLKNIIKQFNKELEKTEKK